MPYCYTTDKKTKIEHCTLPVCKGFEDCYFDDMKTYQGTVSKTKSGKKCLRWDSKELARMRKGYYWRYRAYYPDASVAAMNNYCRQPFAYGRTGTYQPWCYVSAKKREFCNIKACPAPKCGHVRENGYYLSRGRYDRVYIKVGKRRRSYTKTKTQAECVALCKKTKGCKYWNWRTDKFRWKRSRHTCFLFKRYYRIMKSTGVNNGYVNICGSSADEDDGDMP